MKKSNQILLLITIVISIVTFSCKQREFVAGVEHGMHYTPPQKNQPYKIESVEIFDNLFYVKNNADFLYYDNTQFFYDSKGKLDSIGTDYPINLFHIPLDKIEVQGIKADVKLPKETRDKVFLETEKNTKNPMDSLNILGKEWIPFTINSKKVLPFMGIETQGEQLLIVMVPTESMSISVEKGCKNIYIYSDDLYVLLPYFLKKSYHKIWRPGDKFSFEFSTEKQIEVETKRQTTKKSTSNKAEYYIVKPGDNLWKISRKLKISFKKLTSLNDPNKTLHPGDKIRIK